MAHEHSKILIYKVCPGKLKDKYANMRNYIIHMRTDIIHVGQLLRRARDERGLQNVRLDD